MGFIKASDHFLYFDTIARESKPPTQLYIEKTLLLAVYIFLVVLFLLVSQEKNLKISRYMFCTKLLGSVDGKRRI